MEFNSIFLSTIVLLNILPGPAMLFVIQQTMSRGLRAGVLSVAGIELGTLLHFFAAILGLTVVIAKSNILFVCIQHVSALLLIYLGVSQLVAAQKNMSSFQKQLILDKSSHFIFFKGAIINTLNPKILIFFVALLPQWIDSGTRIGFQLSIVKLGGLFCIVGVLMNLVVMLFANKVMINLSHSKQNYDKVVYWMNWVGNVIFILFGINMMILNALNHTY